MRCCSRLLHLALLQLLALGLELRAAALRGGEALLQAGGVPRLPPLRAPARKAGCGWYSGGRKPLQAYTLSSPWAPGYSGAGAPRSQLRRGPRGPGCRPWVPLLLPPLSSIEPPNQTHDHTAGKQPGLDCWALAHLSHRELSTLLWCCATACMPRSLTNFGRRTVPCRPGTF